MFTLLYILFLAYLKWIVVGAVVCYFLKSITGSTLAIKLPLGLCALSVFVLWIDLSFGRDGADKNIPSTLIKMRPEDLYHTYKYQSVVKQK
ncbi:MAG: hypothetical protein K2P98_05120 [Neisseriaceae bacterium]|nr:hypothetical protein [Neisseriaceae bacterium]